MTKAFHDACCAEKTFIIRDIYADARVDPTNYALLKIQSFVSVPLVRDGHWKFLFTIYDSEPRDWRADEIELVQELTASIWTRSERLRAKATCWPGIGESQRAPPAPPARGSAGNRSG